MICGLRNSDDPTSDNLTPQETTKPDAADIALDGAELSCPGSSEVKAIQFLNCLSGFGEP